MNPRGKDAIDTKGRLLDEAERLIAEHGFSAVSLRQITAAAGANLAAVNYHFGGRDRLISEVMARRIGPINQRRLVLLAEMQEAARPGVPPLEQVLDALFRPVVMMRQESAHDRAVFFQLMGRCFAEGNAWMSELLAEEFREVIVKFTDAFIRCMPGAAAGQVHLKMLFSIGVMAHTLLHIDQLSKFTGQNAPLPSLDALTTMMVNYAAAGFRAEFGGEH